MKRFAFLLLFLASVAVAQDVPVVVTGDGEVVKVDKVIKVDVTVYKKFPVKLEFEPDGVFYFWTVPAGVETRKAGSVLWIDKAPNGEVTASVEAAFVVDNDDPKSKRNWKVVNKSGKATFVIGDIKPPPPPPPPPPPSPIPLDGFRVVILYDKTATTADQEAVIYGREVRDLLEAKCLLDPESGSKAYWIIPTGADVAGAPTWVKDVIQRHPGQKAFAVISNGKMGGYDGVIPNTKQEAIDLLRKIGG